MPQAQVQTQSKTKWKGLAYQPITLVPLAQRNEALKLRNEEKRIQKLAELELKKELNSEEEGIGHSEFQRMNAGDRCDALGWRKDIMSFAILDKQKTFDTVVKAAPMGSSYNKNTAKKGRISIHG